MTSLPASRPATPAPDQLLESLHRREEWFRAVFDGSAIGIGVVDMGGRFIEVNPAFQRMVGYTAEEIRGMPFTQLNHPDDNARNVPLFRQLVEGSVSHYQMEKRYRCKDGSVLPVRLTTSVVRDEAGTPRFCVAMVEDITERQRAEVERRALEERLRHNALHDALTGLPNRTLLSERLAAAAARAADDPAYSFAVLFLDLDRFKVVNDSLGHHVGDELLRAVAARLRDCLGPADLVARFGGDEFAILLDRIDGVETAVRAAERILELFSTPVGLDGYEVFTAPSIGIAVSCGCVDRPEHLLRNADMAMYHARASGVARYAVYDQSMHADAMERLRLETELRNALRRGQFRVFYQPIVCLRSGHVAAVEALVRWEHPEDGIIAPDRFVRLAEDTGLIGPIGSWVLRESVRQVVEWRRRLPGLDALAVSVNLSPKQLRDPALLPQIREVLHESGLPAGALKLEITESSLLESTPETTALLDQLKALGVQLYLDDFGTGYSSLSYLHRLPLDALKIDRSFVRALRPAPAAGEGDGGIVRTIAGLARGLGVGTVAEGVETCEQLATLRSLGCNFGQGYLFSPPVPAEVLARDVLAGERRW